MLSDYYDNDNQSLNRWLELVTGSKANLDDPWFKSNDYGAYLRNTLVIYGDLAAQTEASALGIQKEDAGVYGVMYQRCGRSFFSK